MDSPLQPLLLTSNGEALTGLFMVEHKHGPEIEPTWVEDASVLPFPETKKQLQVYFAENMSERRESERKQFDLPLAPQGTDFQKKVWEELTRIPFGMTISYGELAHKIGQPTASRAVGLANGKNPISIIVPCHRVMGANGNLVGYGGGIERKRWLLEHEGVLLRL